MESQVNKDIDTKDEPKLKLDSLFTTVEIDAFHKLGDKKEFQKLAVDLFHKDYDLKLVNEILAKHIVYSGFTKKLQRKIIHIAKETYQKQRFESNKSSTIEFYISDKKTKKDSRTLFYYANDKNFNQMLYKTRVLSESVTGGEFETESYGQPIINAVITDITIIRNKLTEIDKFEIDFITNSNRHVKYKGILSEVLARLRLGGLLANKNKAEDCLSCLITEFERLKLTQIQESLDITGFFINDKQLYAPEEYTKEYNLKELKKGLKVFNEAVEVYYKNFKEKFLKIAKWHLTAPFSFAKKQYNEDNNAVKLQPFQLLLGTTNAGKTKAHRLCSRFYYHYRNPITSESIITLPRLAKELSHSTFPLIVNEPVAIFEQKGKGSPIRDELKNVFEVCRTRGKYSRTLDYMYELAGSNIAFISNDPIKFRDGAEERRFDKFYFTIKDRKTIEENREKFDIFMSTKANDLEVIGQATYQILKEQPSLLLKDYEELAEELFKELYEIAELEIPEWLFTKIIDNEDFDDILHEDVLQGLKDYSVDMLKENRIPVQDKEGDVVFASFNARIQFLTENQMKTQIYVLESRDKKTGQVLDSNYYIMKEFLYYLSKKEINIASLDDLAEILEGKYGKYTRRNIFGSRHAVKVNVNKITGI
jgi:hypothetical protein